MELTGQYEHAWDICRTKGLTRIEFGDGTVTVPTSEFTTAHGHDATHYRVIGTRRFNLGHEHVHKLDLAGGANQRYLHELYPKHVGTLTNETGSEAVISDGQNIPAELVEDLRIIILGARGNVGPDFVISKGTYAREFEAQYRHCTWTAWMSEHYPYFEAGFTAAADGRAPADLDARQRLFDALACHPAVHQEITNGLKQGTGPVSQSIPLATFLTKAGALAFGIYKDH